jgi:ATP-dependent protease HslVU (ClpYQ) peptidase subunit
LTVIVAAQTKRDGIVIAADSEVSWGAWLKQDGFNEKLWADEDGPYIFGGCGTVRDLQVIQNFVQWPKVWREGGGKLTEFAVTQIIPAIKAGLYGHGVVEDRKGREEMQSALIMAWEDNIIEIDSDFSVSPAVKGRCAVGSGYAEAYGSLGDKEIWTKAEVVEAARRATLTAQGVGGEIYVISTKNPVVEKAEG